ncbi:MAG TPA: YafY family transcriptional regulator [Bacteroidetes bacterium]|nr:YafY family transcriptional regulator [Bacteroidota bacterium]
MKSQERRLKILLLLQSRRKNLGVNELAEYFGVSRRTIFRDLNFITEMDVPIAHDSIDGYSIPKGYSIPPLMFTDKEISVIMIGLSFLKSQTDQGMVDDAKSVQLKIENVVPEALRGLIRTMDQSVIVDPYIKKIQNNEIGADWYAISNCISNHNQISFKYKSAITQRIVNPYFLIYFSDHWNMLGYDIAKKAFRNFRLEKISELISLDEKFVPDSKINHESVVYGDPDGLHTIKIQVNRTIWHDLLRTLPAELTSVVEENSHYICEFSFNSLENINVFLLRYGNDVNVLSPNELKDIRNEYLRSMM